MVKNKELQLSKAEEIIKQRIFIIRGHRVMLDADLADLYDIPTGRLNEQLKRNITRFPEDFSFQLSNNEYELLISQFAISKVGRGGRRHLPYVFTEHGVAMLSSILNSDIAIKMNIFIVRAFIKMRESLDQYKDLAVKIGKIELRQKEDGDILYEVHDAVRRLTERPFKPKGHLGFKEKLNP